MRWKPFPIVGGAYKDDARPWSAQDTVNYLVVMAERPGGRSPSLLRGVPGMRAFALPKEAPVRGLHIAEGLLCAVVGDTFYTVASDGGLTAHGTIPGVGRVSMDHNQITGGNQVAIANGISGYVFDTTTTELSHITDEGFPGSISFGFIDGYITAIEPGRRFAFFSQLADATSYNTLDRLEAERQPDRLVGQAISHGEWWLFGERTVELYQNTGAATGTFQRAEGVVIEVGCASGDTIVNLDNSIFWLGNDGIVYRANGYTPERISTHAIEQAISRTNMAQAFAFTWVDRGHAVYYLTFPDGQTWGYDAASGQWHRRQSEGLGRWRINDLVRWNNQWIAGDYSNGLLYALDWDAQHENGSVLERRRTMGVLADSQNAVIVNGLEVVIDTGQEADASVSEYTLSITDDLPDGAVGDVVDFQYDVTASRRPYAVSIASGALPDGLTMDDQGRVTGTRTDIGTFGWSVEVMDATGNVSALSDAATTSGGSGYSGWRFMAIPYSSPYPTGIPNEATTSFDDSAWPIAPAPFGSQTAGNAQPESAHAYDSRLKDAYATNVTLGTGCWIRRHVQLATAPMTDVNVVGFLDNYARIYVNGQIAASQSLSDGGGYTGTINKSLFVPGDNVIAVWCMDDEGVGTKDASYFDFLFDLL